MEEETQQREASPFSGLPGETICVERTDGPVTLRLLDAALWNAFNQEGTEMIITKAGRRMFPFVMVTVEGLSPTLLYSVHMSLVPCDHRQYKFCQRRWVSVSDTAPGPTPTPEQSYDHPASPNRGSFWCQEMISFAKLKITNNKHSQGDIVLQSMRKYMAQITVREDNGDVEYVFPLPETTFVAVTQYQNEAVTRMKIAHNPFANGFKYAHVTGNDDDKKALQGPDMPRPQDSKQKYFAGVKASGKTTRARGTVTPQGHSRGAHHALNKVPSSRKVGSAGLHPAHCMAQVAPLLLPLPMSMDPATVAFAHHHHHLRDGDGCCGAAEGEVVSAFSPPSRVPIVLPMTLPAPVQFPITEHLHRRPGDLHEDVKDENDAEKDTLLPPVMASDKTSDHQTTSDVADNDAEAAYSGPVTAVCEDNKFHTESKDSAEASTATEDAPQPQSGAGENDDHISKTNIVHGKSTDVSDEGCTDLALEACDEVVSGSTPCTTDSSSIPTMASSSNKTTSITTSASPMTVSQVVQTTEKALSLVVTNGNKAMTSGQFQLTAIASRSRLHTFKQPLPRSRSAGSASSRIKNSSKRTSSSSSPSSPPDPGCLDLETWRHRNAKRHADVGERGVEQSVKSCQGVELKLHDLHIWHSFAACGSKMLISSDGRHMFPVISISLRGLDPGRLFSVWLHVTAADDTTPDKGHALWGPLNPITQRSQPPVKPYMHPYSPMRGLAWMKVKVTFSSVKLTSDQSTNDTSCFPLEAGRRYFVQVVIREEEEITPNGAGSGGDLLFFPLPEAAFWANQESDDVKTAVHATVTSRQERKRCREIASSTTVEDRDNENEVTTVLPTKLARTDTSANTWMRVPTCFPSDLSTVFGPRASDITSRLQPLCCVPPMTSNLPPAHMGLLANRMPLTPPLSSIAPFPFPPQLFPHLRTPMHTAFGMAVPSINPFPLLYYPYAVQPVGNPPAAVSEHSTGLDLSVKSSESK